jgi:hypothetical protein
MNPATDKLGNADTVRQLQDAGRQAIDQVAEDQPQPRTRYAARPFEDLRCPVCGTYRCEGC